MQNRNIQPEAGTPHGNLSAVLTGQKSLREILPPYRLSPEQLADILDEPHTRRAWWLNLHSGCDLSTGTTINDLQAAVGRSAGSKTATANGSIGQPAVAPISFSLNVNCSDLAVPMCECAQPVSSIRPFDWQCAKCKGVIPSLTEYLEAL